MAAGKDTSVDITIAGKVDPSLEQSIKEAEQELKGLSGSGGKAEEELGKLSGSTEKAKKGMEGLGKGAEGAKEPVEGFGEGTKDAADSLQDLEQVIVAAGIGKALEALGDEFMECSEAAAEYEKSLKKVETIADTTGTSMGAIHDSLLQLSGDAAVAAGGLSEATYQAISASVDTADAVGFVTKANKLAVGGFTSAASSVDVLTTALNAYNLDIGETEQLSDYLITTQNKGKTSVDELASSLGKVIPVAAAYNVQMDNLSTAYAVLTANGNKAAETTTYVKSMLNELSDTDSAVSKKLFAQTGKSFSELNAAGYSLGDVLQVLGDTVEGDATAFSNMWGSSEAATAALSLYNSGAQEYNKVLGEMRDSAGATQKAYDTMTQTMEFAQQKMSVAAQNLQIAIGEQLNPALSELYGLGADILSGAQGFVEGHPDTVAAITSVATAVGVVTAAVAGYTVVTKAAVVASTALSSMSGIGALGAVATFGIGIAEYIALTHEAVDITGELTFESRKMESELEGLKNSYGKVCAQYGKNSSEAGELALQIDSLQKKYDASKETIGEFSDRIKQLGDSITDTYSTYQESINATQDLSDRSTFLVSELVALKGQSGLTSAEMQTMKGIVDELNGSYGELGLTLDEATGKLNYSTDDLFDYVTKAAEKQNTEDATKGLTEQLQGFSELKKRSEQAWSEVDAAHKNYEKLSKEWSEAHPVLDAVGVSEFSSGDVSKAWEEYQKSLDDFADASNVYDDGIAKIREYGAQLGYTGEELDDFVKRLEKVPDAAGKTADKLSGAKKINSGYAEGMEKAETAISGVSGRLQELGASFDKSYKKAYENIDAQMGLFDKYETKTKMTTDKMLSAWKSQEKYLKRYSKNIEKAGKIGLDDTVVQKLSDGSQEAAGQLDVIVKKYKEIENSSGKKAAQKWIKQFNKQFEAVEESKVTFSKAVAAMEEDFGAAMKDILKELRKSVGDMDMAGTAGLAANATMDAYISAIKSKAAEAQKEAGSVAEAVAEALELGGKRSQKKAQKFTAKNGAGGKGVSITPEAEGDILTRPTLVLAAEAGYDEAYIPINGSPRSKALWEETGKKLGLFQEPGTAGRTSSATDNGGHTLESRDQAVQLSFPYSPNVTIQGNAGKSEVTQALDMSFEKFKRYAKQFVKEEIRRSMGGGTRWKNT